MGRLIGEVDWGRVFSEGRRRRLDDADDGGGRAGVVRIALGAGEGMAVEVDAVGGIWFTGAPVVFVATAASASVVVVVVGGGWGEAFIVAGVGVGV